MLKCTFVSHTLSTGKIVKTLFIGHSEPRFLPADCSVVSTFEFDSLSLMLYE